MSETTGSNDPGTKFVAVDAPIGTINRVQGAHEGKTAKLWKVVKVNGKEISREEFNTSSYSASPAIYEVGVSSYNLIAVDNMNAAIATQDEATIRAAAASWADNGLGGFGVQDPINDVTTQPGVTPQPDTGTSVPDPGTTVPDPGTAVPDPGNGTGDAGTQPDPGADPID